MRRGGYDTRAPAGQGRACVEECRFAGAHAPGPRTRDFGRRQMLRQWRDWIVATVEGA